MNICVAQNEDFASWLYLAAEVEHLFGPMVNEPGFHQALHKNIGRGSAYCIRENNGSPGTPLLGGMLFSPKPPIYNIGWLAVTQPYRRCGLGRLLVEYVINLVVSPAEMRVTTFGKEVEGGQAARRFYEQLGFQPTEMATNGPEGGSRQIYRRIFY